MYSLIDDNHFAELKKFGKTYCPKDVFCDGSRIGNLSEKKKACMYFIDGKCTHPYSPKNKKKEVVI